MNDKKILDRVNPQRRKFMKKFVVGTAFVVPAMVSFDMDSLSVHVGASAYAVGSGAGGGEG